MEGIEREPYIHKISLPPGTDVTKTNEEDLIRNQCDSGKFTEGHLYVLYFYLDPDPVTNSIKLIITVY